LPAEWPGEKSGRLDQSSSSTCLLDVSHNRIDFGLVPQGGSQRQYFELSNSTVRALEIDRIETSCDCLSIDLGNPDLKPREKTLGLVTLDLSHAPGFIGKLTAEVAGVGVNGDVWFKIQVEVDVRPSKDFGKLGTDPGLERRTNGDLPSPVPMPLLETGGQ